MSDGSAYEKWSRLAILLRDQTEAGRVHWEMALATPRMEAELGDLRVAVEDIGVDDKIIRLRVLDMFDTIVDSFTVNDLANNGRVEAASALFDLHRLAFRQANNSDYYIDSLIGMLSKD